MDSHYSFIKDTVKSKWGVTNKSVSGSVPPQSTLLLYYKITPSFLYLIFRCLLDVDKTGRSIGTPVSVIAIWQISKGQENGLAPAIQLLLIGKARDSLK